jgi:hypothetical protein
VLLEKDNAEVFDSIIELLYRTPFIEENQAGAYTRPHLSST